MYVYASPAVPARNRGQRSLSNSISRPVPLHLAGAPGKHRQNVLSTAGMPPGQQQQNASLKVLLALLACSAVTTRVLAGPRAPPAVQPRLSWNTFVLQQLRSGSPNCRGAPNYPCIIPKDTKVGARVGMCV